LILYELLAGENPYASVDKEEYRKAALAHRARKPRLVGELKDGVSEEQVTSFIHRCLSPVAADRPTAQEVNLVLNGRQPESAPKPHPPSPPVPPVPPTPPAKSRPSPLTRLELVSESGKSLNFGVRTEVGKHLCRPLGEDARFFAVEQFVVERTDDGTWLVSPDATATNQTILNGKALTAPEKLNEGDELGVGNEAKGIVKLPLSVRIV
jgi:hypothetical protein